MVSVDYLLFFMHLLSMAEDSLSPYYIHPNDNLGSLVSQPLNGENYAWWNHTMKLEQSKWPGPTLAHMDLGKRPTLKSP